MVLVGLFNRNWVNVPQPSDRVPALILEASPVNF
jgi:hypothetical protein